MAPNEQDPDEERIADLGEDEADGEEFDDDEFDDDEDVDEEDEEEAGA